MRKQIEFTVNISDIHTGRTWAWLSKEVAARDARWNAAKSNADCSAYMAIEAQRSGALGFEFIRQPQHRVRGPSWMRGATASVVEHYRYARQQMNITDEDQNYA